MYGLAMTPLACAFSVISTFGGHGDYRVARILLPLACLCMDHAGAPFTVVAIALLLWPAYGLFLSQRRRGLFNLLLVVAVHAGSVVWLFTKGSGPYS